MKLVDTIGRCFAWENFYDAIMSAMNENQNETRINDITQIDFYDQKIIDICQNYIESSLTIIYTGLISAQIYSDKRFTSGSKEDNKDKEDDSTEIKNPVFMALIQKYFLEGSQPLYSKIEMSRPKKAALIHFLRDRKVSAKGILSNHLGMKKLSDENQIIFDEIVAKINSTTEGNIQELFNNNKQNQATHQP